MHIITNFDKSTCEFILKNNNNVSFLEEPESNLDFFNFSKILNNYRNEIDKINSDDWKRIRWYINEYDFVVIPPIINRAFYKYWEIIYEFDLINIHEKVLHCAEAPGGFIQGTSLYYLKHVKHLHKYENNKSDYTLVEKKKKNVVKNIYTISLNKDYHKYKVYNLPSYNKNIITKNVCITYGKDNTGDINNLDNLYYIKNKNGGEKFFLITADGGFDEGIEFNIKEQLHYKLILGEIISALVLQKNNGNFVLKMFDIFTETSCHLLYVLCMCYDEIYCYKPLTSRPTNSEKYIVCKKFNIEQEKLDILLNYLNNIMNKINKEDNYKYISIRIFESLPKEFMNNLYTINYKITKKQCGYLEKAIKLSKDNSFIKKYDGILQQSIHKRNIVFSDWKTKYKFDF